MAKKKEVTAETAVSQPETSEEPRNLIGAAIEHMRLAANMLRNKGGKHAEPCALVAGELERRAEQLERLGNE